MVDMTWQDFVSQSANVSKSIMVKVAEETKKTVCEIFYASPGAFITDIGTSNELLNGQRLLMDTLCDDPQRTPPPPSVPFSGGQCPCQDYQVSYQATVDGNLFGPVQSFVTKGPIGKYRIEISGTGKILFSRGSANCPLPDFLMLEGDATEVSGGRFKITNFTVTPINGQPDICPSLPPSYPVPFGPPNSLDRTVSFPVSPTINAPVSVKIVPTFVPIVNVFRPELNVDVGGVRVNVSLGGFTFSPNVALPVNTSFPTFNFPITSPAPTPVKTPPATGGSTFDPTEVLRQIERTRKEVEECCDRLNPFEAVPAGKFIVTSLGSGNSGSFQLPARSFRVILILTSDTAKLKQQSGDNAPTVFYAGWVWFEVDGGMMERMPVDALTKAYETPSRATGKFAFKLYSDYTCSVSVRSSVKPT